MLNTLVPGSKLFRIISGSWTDRPQLARYNVMAMMFVKYDK